jgi:mono/diheme cytochrome c family protein
MFRHLEGPRSIGRGLFFCPSAALNFHLTFCGLLLALLLFDSRGANSMRQCLILFLLMFTTACEGTFESSEFSGHDFSDSQASTAPNSSALDSPGGTSNPQSILEGAALYQANCSACHGAVAEGAPAFPNSIQGFEPIAELVANGRGAMPSLNLVVDDVAKIQYYLISLAAPTDTLDGAGLYGRYCSSCHGADASGGPTWASSIQAYEPIAQIVADGRGTMPAVPITAAQTDLIQAWLLTLAAPAADLDGEGLYVRYCSSCHGADASGGANWATSIQGYEPIDGIVSNGRGNMDPIPIDAAQSAKVQAYLLTLAPALSTLSGPEVYDRLCVGCHGDVGAGIDTKGMQLRYDDDAFSAYWVRAGRGTNAFDSPMPAYPASMISNQQLDEMFTWIRSEPHPTDGEGLFNQYCANCHGADGRGGSSGESIRGSGAFTGVVRQGKNRADGYDRRRSYMSAWTSAQISDAEIQLISAYAAGL